MGSNPTPSDWTDSQMVKTEDILVCLGKDFYMTHATRDTTTGLKFEEIARINRQDGENISKTKLKSFIQKRGVNPLDYLSWMFQPDEAYYLPATNEVIIYEKKSQSTSGSADEKLGACAWKIMEYKRLFRAVGIDTVSYIYIFNDWFKQERYSKLLEYIRSVPDCDYMFNE